MLRAREQTHSHKPNRFVWNLYLNTPMLCTIHDLTILRSLLISVWQIYVILVVGCYSCFVFIFTDETIEFILEYKYSLKNVLTHLQPHTHTHTNTHQLDDLQSQMRFYIDRFIDGRQCVVLPTKNIQIL